MMQRTGPTYSARPHIYPTSFGLWWCQLKGGGPYAMAARPDHAYAHWRMEVERVHHGQYDHAIYFPGDPQWVAPQEVRQ